MTLTSTIETLLQAAFAPVKLDVRDDSARHKGHKGHAGSGGSHFIVHIVSAAFEGKTPLERHRAVYAALDALMREQIHALKLTTQTPDEYNHR